MLKKGLAVAVILLFIGVAFTSSIDASIDKSDLIKDKSKNDTFEVNIDSDICLTKRHLPFLTKYSDEIENNQIKQLLDEIVDSLHRKGILTSEDLKHIVTKLSPEIEVLGLHSGLIETGDWPYRRCPAVAACFPGFFRCAYYTFISKGGLMHWIADDIYSGYGVGEVKVTINRETVYDYDHSGFAIGYFGWIRCVTQHPLVHGPEFSVLWGFAPLIIIYHINYNR